MKGKLTLRNVLICAGAFLAILVFVFSFLTALRSTSSYGDAEALNVIWGSTQVKDLASGKISDLPEARKALGLPLVGVILVLVGGLCALVMALFGEKLIKDEKVRKIVLLVAAGLVVLGGVFQFFVVSAYISSNAKEAGVTVEEYKKQLEVMGVTLSSAMSIVSGILAILGGGAICASQFVADKKLGK